MTAGEPERAPVTAVREHEIKLTVEDGFVLPDLAAALPDATSTQTRSRHTLTATYLDTPDLRLARGGITLRRRTGGKDDGWHLKLPTASQGVREELTADDTGTGPPAALTDLVRARVRYSPLREVATLVTERTAVVLRDAAGTDLVEVVDDSVRVLESDARFRELEVEDLGGGRQALTAVGDVLRRAGAVQGGFTPKLVQALGGRATAPADPPPPPRVGPDRPAGDAVTAYLRHHVRRLLEEDPRVRLDAEDAVHQMRVAARRLRSGLRTFGPLVDEEWARSLRDELSWLGSSLGAARDGEVLLARLQSHLAALPDDLVRADARRRLAGLLGPDLDSARREVSDALGSDRYLDLVERLVAGATAPPLTDEARRPASEVLPGLVKHVWKRLLTSARAVRGEDSAPEAYHAVRIAAKRARYAAEAVAPALGKAAARSAAAAESVQELLGEHQDAVVAAEALRGLAGRRGVGAAAFTFGVLHEREQAAAARARAQFAELWPQVSRRRDRRWMDA